ncbi:MAG: hypothetical protein EXX96DRAFT_569108 [Benjaminiella poitrasii]|nr:MAG: hypothetical protein EXX96DRAFT_569108 [Benjaminiella poitrasii]
MDQFQAFSGQYNPQIYESSNVPPSTDRLFSISGFQAGLMTNTAQQQQQQQPSASASSSANPFPSQSYIYSSNHQPFNTSFSSQFQPSINASNLMNSIPNTIEDNNNGRYSGMYANTGFDMLSILSRVANRPNPQIHLGPVDLSCSFVVVDAKQYDFPLVYTSPMFERLTGYASHEVIGHNCRVLQAPDGRVAIGSRRKYTDNTAVYHIKTHMIQGKESQCSIINYRKTGQPFVNLLTVIPITTFESSDEIDYFVGLQVDLVEQLNCTFQSMKDGTYTVNYRNSTIPPSIMQSGNNHDINPQEWAQFNNSNASQLVYNSDTQNNLITTTNFTSHINGNNKNNNNSNIQRSTTTTNTAPTTITTNHDSITEPPSLDIESIIKEASTDKGKFKKYLHELLLDEIPDFVHVLTIKGVFLFCSESTRSLLEYEPSELVGQSLKSICHPSDITTVMRELKQASTSQSPLPIVNLIYRIQRKHSGFTWIECHGKLCNEDRKGRKYAVLSGRERPVYHLSRTALALGNKTHQQQTGGTEDHEFWGKLSLDGLLLYVSWTSANILGSRPEQTVGLSLYQLMRSNRMTDLTRALAEVKEGKIVYLRHALLNHEGMEVMVATTFYPDGFVGDRPTFVLMQTKAMNDETSMVDDEPVFISMDPDVKKKGRADDWENQHQKSTGIEELDLSRDASWQYELHQLRISNNKLREKLGALIKKAKQEGNEEGVAVCQVCFRRLPGLSEITEYASDKPLLCNTCSLRDASAP